MSPLYWRTSFPSREWSDMSSLEENPLHWGKDISTFMSSLPIFLLYTLLYFLFTLYSFFLFTPYFTWPKIQGPKIIFNYSTIFTRLRRRKRIFNLWVFLSNKARCPSIFLTKSFETEWFLSTFLKFFKILTIFHIGLRFTRNESGNQP